jgi:hypothetical protein
MTAKKEHTFEELQAIEILRRKVLEKGLNPFYTILLSDIRGTIFTTTS